MVCKKCGAEEDDESVKAFATQNACAGPLAVPSDTAMWWLWNCGCDGVRSLALRFGDSPDSGTIHVVAGSVREDLHGV